MRPISSFQSGWANSARVNIPVPDPILHQSEFATSRMLIS
jgi:hypothetical protein